MRRRVCLLVAVTVLLTSSLAASADFGLGIGLPIPNPFDIIGGIFSGLSSEQVFKISVIVAAPHVAPSIAAVGTVSVGGVQVPALCTYTNLGSSFLPNWVSNTVVLASPNLSRGCQALGINPSGVMVGAATISGVDGYIGLLWNGPDAAPTVLQGLGGVGSPGTAARAINAAGQVTGWSMGRDNFMHAVRWGTDGSPLDLGRFAYGNAINAEGQIAGLRTDPVLGYTSFLYTDAWAMISIGPTHKGEAADINDLGWVTGYFRQTSGSDHAYLWKPPESEPDLRDWGADTTILDVGGTFLDLGGLGSYGSNAYGINNVGWIVGRTSVPVGPYYHAFLYIGDKMYDLNDLVTPDSGYTFDYAIDVTDEGYILAHGKDPEGKYGYFLLGPGADQTDVPEPGTLGLLGVLAIPGWVLARKRRRAR